MMDALVRFAARWHARAIYWTTWLWHGPQPGPDPDPAPATHTPVPHVGATEAGLQLPKKKPRKPQPIDLVTTRKEALEADAQLAKALNNVEAELFAGLNEMMDRVLARFDLSYADLMEHGGWAGVHELVEVG